MKAHTNSFKEQIKLIGKEIDSRITFGSTVLGKDDLNAVTPSYQGAILKSVMKQLDIDSNVEIPIGTILKYEFGLKVNGEYEYINYGNYIVYSIEKQEDTNSYKITCYDKLLYSMLDYVKLPITYPISVRDYINSLSTVLGLKFANKSGTFANYDKQIQADLYDGLGYTFRDILDELAQVTASTICLNNNDELEIRYITETGDTIDEEYLKDVNVNFGEKFGAVNTIVLSRSAGSDNIYYPTVLPTNPYEIKISDNQIMNGNDRADFLPDIYNKLNGLEFYTNDFVSTGIVYYDLCDRYSVKVGDNTYSCVMFNDEILVTQGLEENVYTELPEQTETDYKHASKDDRMINQVYIIAKKNEAEILALVSTTETIQKEINPTKDESGSNIIIEDASNNPLIQLEIEGKSTQKTRSGKNILDVFSPDWVKTQCILNPDGSIRANIQGAYYAYLRNTTDKFKNYILNNKGKKITFSVGNTIENMGVGIIIYGTRSDGSTYQALENGAGSTSCTVQIADNFTSISAIELRFFRKYPIETFTDTISVITKLQLEEGSTATEYEEYGVSPSPDYPSEIKSVGYENLFDKNNYEINSLAYKFDISKLEIGKTYTLASNLPLTRIKISNDRDGYNSVYYNVEDGFYNYTFTMVRNENIPENYEQYLMLRLTDNWVTDISQLDEYKISITEGAKVKGYVSTDKYGIEVKTVGKNLLNATYYNANNYVSQLLRLKAGSYIVHHQGEISSAIYIRKADNSIPINGTSISEGYNRNQYTFTINEYGNYYIQFYKGGTGFTSFSNAQLEKGSVATDYEPYQEPRISVIELNAPLRSLPNRIKDIAYIKNNRLYVDRYLGGIILDGSADEGWYINLNNTNYISFYLSEKPYTDIRSGITNYFGNVKVWSNIASAEEEGFWWHTGSSVGIKMLKSRLTNVETSPYTVFRQWLEEHPVEIVYPLISPYTEDYGEIKMLKTLKGYNEISTTDDLLPIINLTYVRDTILADYVENHVAELKITEGEIKTRVETVSSSVDGLNTSINRVEEITNDNSQIINVISKNIITEGDKAGTVTEVTTTTGFTFNKDGMTIDDGSGFKAQHRATGTYYKDGESVIGQYTKDGSKQKDLELFGTYSYGKESIDDTPMFVGQLYNDENGEECFGHFYNEGDY